VPYIVIGGMVFKSLQCALKDMADTKMLTSFSSKQILVTNNQWRKDGVELPSMMGITSSYSVLLYVDIHQHQCGANINHLLHAVIPFMASGCS